MMLYLPATRVKALLPLFIIKKTCTSGIAKKKNRKINTNQAQQTVQNHARKIIKNNNNNKMCEYMLHTTST